MNTTAAELGIGLQPATTFGGRTAFAPSDLKNGTYTNPGRNGDESEALIDLEWSHAAAPGPPLRRLRIRRRRAIHRRFVNHHSNTVSDRNGDGCDSNTVAHGDFLRGRL